jgi:hypothetical protein
MRSLPEKAMTQSNSVFHLKVQQIEQVCLFELSWGRGQQISVALPYPDTLSALYQEWSSVYLSFYKTALRGRVAAKGSIAPPPVDWHAKLVQVEAKLLYEFHQWLRQGDLYEIRSTIAQAVRDGERGKKGLGAGNSPSPNPQSPIPKVEVFLACNPLELARLPWEAWEIGTEFAATGKIRIVRTPINIQQATAIPQRRRRRARVLAILGDDTGLNFHADKEAVRSLASVAEVQFVGWQPGQNIDSLKAEIVKTIADERGWDVLFFAGHSNETILTGGELAIAPGVSLFLSEIAQPLTVAKERGLQFALFNSCNGLSLANALINLGLSQVAVMREPVHNRVAQEFLVRFLQRLAEYKDVHESLLAACQYLKLEKHLTYPSAYLIPSLFRHPDAPLFRIEPFGLKQQIQRWLPTKREAIALAGLVLVSGQIPAQSYLLEQRVFAQAVYRQLTNQVPAIEPPVLLVQIDDESIERADISSPRPMDRSYLARLIDKLSVLKAKVIGIDYLLDRSQKPNDQKLAQSIRASVQQQGTWFVFASHRKDGGGWFEVLPELANPNWSLQGDIRLLGDRLTYMSLAPMADSEYQRPPLAYLVALARWLNGDRSMNPPQPHLSSSSDWRSQLKAYITETRGKDYKTIFSPTARLQPLTNLAYRFRQMWLHPIVDFSIPPEQVYQRVPAWQLLESKADSPVQRQLMATFAGKRQPVVIIAPGGYAEAGVSAVGEDNFPLPAALSYWRSQQNPPDPRKVFPGNEAHAYMINHFLNQRLVVPIPDLWLVGIAALLGKGTALALEKGKGERGKGKGKRLLFLLPDTKGKAVLFLASGTAVYGLASLQLYITAAMVLPWTLPVVTLWTYILLALSQKNSHV